MSRTYVISEIVGTSETSLEDAIEGGLASAAQSLTNLEWFEVGQIRGHIVDGRVGHYQVGIRLGFRFAESGESGLEGETGKAFSFSQRESKI